MGNAFKGYCARWIRTLKTVTIIGSKGQLGADLVKTFTAAGWGVLPLEHSQIEVENLDSVNKSLSRNKSDWIINTAAFHKVEECEKNSEKSWLINSRGPLNVAKVANALDSRTVFISSDFVFSGDLSKELSHDEDHPVSPINTYGHSKAGGELATLCTDQDNLVVRISSVFGCAGSSGKGGNFVESIIAKAKKNETLNVFDDIQMSPTYTMDAAQIICAALEANLTGIVHASNLGSTTWFSFAKKIIELTNLNSDLNPIQTNSEIYPKRPLNSALGSKRFLGKRSDWQDGLQRYLVEKGHIK